MLLPAIYAVLVGVGVFIVVWTLGASAGPAAEVALRRRLDTYEGRAATLEELELELPLGQRLFRPLIDRLAHDVGRRTPVRTIETIGHRLERGGIRSITAAGLVAVQVALALLLAAVMALVGLLTQQVLVVLLGVPLGVIAGAAAPLAWLDIVIRRRHSQILRTLPDAMDMLTISVEAGLSFESALANVAERFDNALGDEFEQVLLETRLGRPRFEAMEAMATRAGVEDLQNFVQAVIQSQQLGVSIARILRLQAGELRRRRRQRVQEEAAKASLKMLFPMVGCIFPTLWIVLLGPSLVLLLRTLR